VIPKIGRQHVIARRQIVAHRLPVAGGSQHAVQDHQGWSPDAAQIAMNKFHEARCRVRTAGASPFATGALTGLSEAFACPGDDERWAGRMPLRAPVLVVALAIGLAGCTPPPSDVHRATLGRALTLHASFDHGPDADFARGDPTLYSYANARQRTDGGLVGLPDATISIAQGSGRFGNALLFSGKTTVRPYFKDGGNIGYHASDWSGSVSVWLRITPDVDLEPGYCDPVQFIGDDTNKGFIFLEWDRDSNPRYFRYAIRPLQEIWDPQKVGWAALPFDQRPMVQVDRAPFSRARWTHCVFTYDRINAKDAKPSGRLYIDGQLQGTIENWDLTFGWDPASALLVLGASYIGHLDELAVFDRALTDEEVLELYQLPSGVRELYRSPSL